MDGFNEWLSKYPNVVIDTYGLYMKAAWQESAKQLREDVAWYFECKDMFPIAIKDYMGVAIDEAYYSVLHAEQQLKESVDVD